ASTPKGRYRWVDCVVAKGRRKRARGGGLPLVVVRHCGPAAGGAPSPIPSSFLAVVVVALVLSVLSSEFVVSVRMSRAVAVAAGDPGQSGPSSGADVLLHARGVRPGLPGPALRRPHPVRHRAAGNP